MSKSRIVSISHMIKEAFVKVKDCDQIIVAMGKHKDSEGNNSIVMMYCNDGNSDENTFQIETEIKEVENILLLVTDCLISSGLNFDSVQALNLDDSTIDMDNLKSDLKLIVYIN